MAIRFPKRPESRVALARAARAHPLWGDPLLQSAFLFAGLLVVLQVMITALSPLWMASAATWFQPAVTALGLIPLVLTSRWVSRTRRSGARAWWLLSGGYLAYTLGLSCWRIGHQVLYTQGVPLPWWPDVFCLLKYPFFLLALVLWPAPPRRKLPGLTRGKMVVDNLLVMAAATALSWYFLLAPLYQVSGLPLLSKLDYLSFPFGDLGLLFALVIALLPQNRHVADRVALRLLFVAIASFLVADTSSTYLRQHPGDPLTGVSDLLFLLSAPLIPLAALVYIRLTRHDPLPSAGYPLRELSRPPPRKMGLLGSLRFLGPFVAALLAGGIIVVHATLTDTPSLVPFLVACALLLLATVRQAISLLENDQLRSEREEARAKELALEEANRRMETFLGIASHELNTPLTVLKMYHELMQRRLHRLARQQESPAPDVPGLLAVCRQDHACAEAQITRLSRLVQDLLDVSRIQADRLGLRLAQVDLVELACGVVEEQRLLHPGRRICWSPLPQMPFTVQADADRLRQVVLNYLTNALKYAPEADPIGVGIECNAHQVEVWVQDHGPGLTSTQQAHLWERFYRAPGMEVLSGSGVGLGLGLHICKAIVEQHHGQVGVQSTPGEGSTFWFTLPLAPPLSFDDNAAEQSQPKTDAGPGQETSAPPGELNAETHGFASR